MKIIWITPVLLIQSYLTIGSHMRDEYSQYSFYQKRPLSPRPLDAMADLTNDLGVCVLRILAAGGAIGNVGFSPFGLMAVSVLLYEGSSGYSALQIKQSLNLPWEILAVRIGVRDLNRYLKTYFKSDGFLNGLTMSREEVCLTPQFKRVLRLYGFDDPNSFLIDSCPESASTTTHPVQQMSVTSHGTVITEIVPTSQIIQVSGNVTNGTASEVTSSTEFPAKVTYMGDTTFAITNIDTMNTNLPMNSQTNVMVVDVETRPYTRPIESSTNQAETTILIDELGSSNETKVTDNRPNGSDASITTAPITSDDPMMAVATATVTQTSADAVSDYTLNSHTDQSMYTTNNYYNNELRTSPAAGTTYRTTFADVFDVKDETSLSGDSYTSSTIIDQPAAVGSTESVPKITTESVPNTTNDRYVLVGNTTAEATMTVTTSEVIMTTTDTDETRSNILDIDNGNTAKTIIVPSTKPLSDSDGAITVTTAAFETNITPEKSTVQTTVSEPMSTDNDYKTTTDEDIITSTRTTDVSSTTVNSNSINATENEIIKVAESNRHYQVASLQEKKRSLQSNDDNLPTFNVEFVVRKEDLRADCNQTRKRTVIKPDRILTEYPKNSGISIKLRELKKRKRRHLQQFQGYNVRGYGNQWYNGQKNYYGPPSDWIDRLSDDPFEANLFNAGYRRIPFFTYTAVLPFGFVFELKSQVIEIPLDDPKYTLMIIMPNHPSGLSELLLLLPTMSLRSIHNFLKPTAVHATIPTFKYTAKVDLTSALQQVGIQDVFYRYKADLSFMSPDARLFVTSIQQVVSVTAKKYNTPPVFEIQRKYVEYDFVVSRPFVYFVIDVHTKVSLIAGVITDPLASPIWV